MHFEMKRDLFLRQKTSLLKKIGKETNHSKNAIWTLETIKTPQSIS